jgi:2-methylcitrate dehydratase PrpD
MSIEPAPAGPDAADLIAAHLARTSFTDLPAATVAAAKASILDTLACMLAGSASDDVAAITGLVGEWGGRPCSTVVLGGGLKVPPIQAVLANGAMVHQFDYDDTHDLAICHPTSASLPPALALAEAAGEKSGRDLITAVALGSDLACRVALAIDGGLIDHPWFRAPVVGLFGATAAAAKMLGASAEQHLEALGLALPLVSCTRASLHHGGSSVRSIRDGLVYRNGVLAAELAMRGVHGDKAVFDGPYGFYQVFFRGAYHREKLLDGLGERYETEQVSLKPWPSRRTLHRTITAVLDVMAAQDLSFEQVAHVDVFVGAVNRPWCQPVRTGLVPRHRIDLLNNMLFAVGAAIRHRDVALRLYCDPALADDVVTQAVPKVRWHEVGASGAGAISEQGHVRIVTVGGETYEGRCDVPLGHPARPMSPAQRRAKFVACAANGVRPLGATRAAEIVDVVTRLEELADVGELTRLLV